MNPFQVVKDFESALCDYTGAPYCVTTTSCTMALLLSLIWKRQWDGVEEVVIPKRTYVGVLMSARLSGMGVGFIDSVWQGRYELLSSGVWDCARWLTAGMFDADRMMCLSFHPTKHLGISTHGGAILHDDPNADEWFRMARFDGRKEGVEPKDQTYWVLGYHAYMTPPTAAEGLQRLATLPKINTPLPNSDYPDLSKLEIFR